MLKQKKKKKFLDMTFNIKLPKENIVVVLTLDWEINNGQTNSDATV